MKKDNGFKCLSLKEEGKLFCLDDYHVEIYDKDFSHEEMEAALHESKIIADIITPNEFANKVLRILTVLHTEIEDSHIASDNLMENLLISMGYEDAVKIARSFNRYYV